MRRATLHMLALVGSLGSACGVTRLDAGSTDAGHGGESVDGRTWAKGFPWIGTASNTFDEPCTLPADASIAGTWQGEFDAYELPSGSSSIRVDVTGAYRDKDGLCGAVVFGRGEPPPIATDAMAWPPGTPAPNSRTPSTVLDAPNEGFVYQFYAAGTPPDGGFASDGPALKGNRARFGINLRQVYESWCNLQRSYALEPPPDPVTFNFLSPLPSFNCMPPEAILNGTDGSTCDGFGGVTFKGFSCAQVTLCTLHACDCSVSTVAVDGVAYQQGCTVVPAATTIFDLTLEGDTLTGDVYLHAGTKSVHLTRVP